MKYYSDIHFHQSEDAFKHNLGDDFACFALWKSARPYQDKIRELLQQDFSIVLEAEIEWTEEHFQSNALRLYEAPIYYGTSMSELKSGHFKKIGDTKFILFIVKDKRPKYTYAMSVSGKIEISNMNIVKAKYQMRDWVQVETGIKYGIHSTNNIFEFFFQVPLLLGKERFIRILNGEKIEEKYIPKDLEGAGGWKSYQEMFDILNLTTNYLVQRGFKTLPESNPEMDIDFLTDNHQRLASALGISQRRNKSYKGFLTVNEEEVSIDIRYVGDKYYSVNWAQNILSNKNLVNGVFVPRKDDYFFSLLYHAKVQKPAVKNKYIPILNKIAQELEFDWYTTTFLDNNETIGKLLNGYFLAHSYVYENPLDNGVYKNKEVIAYLPKPNASQQTKEKYKRVKYIARKLFPGSVIRGIKKMWKR